MKLYEFEGHRIFAKAGIASPFFVVVSDIDEVKQARRRLKFPIVAKVQVLSGRRGKSGGIKVCTTEKQLVSFAKEQIGADFNGEQVRFLILAEKVEIAQENYISITYDTARRSPFLLYSKQGGVDIEELARISPDAVVRLDFDAQVGPTRKELERIFKSHYSSNESEGFILKVHPRLERSGFFARNKNVDILVDFAQRLWDAFWRYDCRLVEVNPLVRVGANPKQHPRGELGRDFGHPGGEQSYVAVDAKVILDDAGMSRHKDLNVLSKGAIGAIPSKRELEAKKIDSEDYRGSAGSTFIEFSGDIAILASGGGASLLVMDSVVAAGGEPANYTEYSGNPPAEKVEKLTKITLSRPDLCGCLVCGAVANFTDIYETLSGFVNGLRRVKPKVNYPIVIRRGGPKQKEAYEMLTKFAKKEGFDIHLFGPETPISVACKKMVELSQQFKNVNTSR